MLEWWYRKTVKYPLEAAQSLRDNLIIVFKYLQGKNTEHWTNDWELQTDKLKLKWGTIFLKVRLINHWNKGSAWILIVLHSSNHGWMSFLKVKHNLWDSEGNNQQNLNDLFERVCQNNYRIYSLLFFSSLTWSHVFHNFSQKILFRGHISQNPPHIRQWIQKPLTHILWKWHHISLWLVLLISILVLLNVSYIASRMSISYDKCVQDIKAFCAKYIRHKQTEWYRSLYIKISCSKSVYIQHNLALLKTCWTVVKSGKPCLHKGNTLILCSNLLLVLTIYVALYDI